MLARRCSGGKVQRDIKLARWHSIRVYRIYYNQARRTSGIKIYFAYNSNFLRVIRVNLCAVHVSEYGPWNYARTTLHWRQMRQKWVTSNVCYTNKHVSTTSYIYTTTIYMYVPYYTYIYITYIWPLSSIYGTDL